MPTGKRHKAQLPNVLQPLPEVAQLGARVYQALVNRIVNGQVEFGAPLRPEVIARQLEVSTTPVREAMQRLENDGLAIKLPYQGWFVREFGEQQVRELYELRAGLECCSFRWACERITDEEIAFLRKHQAVGEAALAAGDMEAYRNYNRDLHEALMRAARNSYLISTMGQLRLQTEMLMAKTIRIIGRPLRAIEEHHELIELLARRDAKAGEPLMARHIMSALRDILRFGREQTDHPGGGSLEAEDPDSKSDEKSGPAPV